MRGGAYWGSDVQEVYSPAEEDTQAVSTAEESLESQSRGPNIALLSLGIGVSMTVVALAVWEGSRRIRKDVTEILLEEGYDSMTLREAEIVKKMMKMEKFTVPDLTKGISISRQSVWKLVRKMVDKGLVEETRDKKPQDGGRGKPSKIYRYVGKKRTKADSSRTGSAG